MATKQCSKCKAEFACTVPLSGCWCEYYKLADETLAELRQQYDNCLCPACLSAYAMCQQQDTTRQYRS